MQRSRAPVRRLVHLGRAKVIRGLLDEVSNDPEMAAPRGPQQGRRAVLVARVDVGKGLLEEKRDRLQLSRVRGAMQRRVSPFIAQRDDGLVVLEEREELVIVPELCMPVRALDRLRKGLCLFRLCRDDA